MQKKPKYFCTLFGINYFHKGLALYRSLNRVSDCFHLFILCMDQKTYKKIRKLKLKHVTLIKRETFERENKELLSVKNERSFAEYCWTSTPFLPFYIFKKYKNVSIVSYIDADLYFFFFYKKINKKYK